MLSSPRLTDCKRLYDDSMNIAVKRRLYISGHDMLLDLPDIMGRGCPEYRCVEQRTGSHKIWR